MSPIAKPKFKNPRARFNFQGRSVSVAGVGAYVPAKALTNFELEKIVATTDEWITSRTGIKERRIAATHSFQSQLHGHCAVSRDSKSVRLEERSSIAMVRKMTRGGK